MTRVKNDCPLLLPQTGSLSEAFRFSPKGRGQVLGQLERRKGVGSTDLGRFVYDPSKGSLNTVALDGTIPADQIRLQVRHSCVRMTFYLQTVHFGRSACTGRSIILTRGCGVTSCRSSPTMATHCIRVSTACASMAGSQRRESETGKLLYANADPGQFSL